MPRSTISLHVNFCLCNHFLKKNKHVPIKIGLYIKNGTPLGLSSDINSKKLLQFSILK